MPSRTAGCRDGVLAIAFEGWEAVRGKKKTGGFRPFENLGHMIPYADLPAERPPRPAAGDAVRNPKRSLFIEAMADVHPLRGPRKVERIIDKPPVHGCFDPETETVSRLQQLILHGKGFDVSLTGEYVQGGAATRHPDLIRRLHAGDFSIEGHLDLHGLTVRQAESAVSLFLSEAARKGLRTVLIIHGRGLSSPCRPVLKSSVIRWLSSHRWRKWVLAYCSARGCDGGAGATCVLLRKKTP